MLNYPITNILPLFTVDEYEKGQEDFNHEISMVFHLLSESAKAEFIKAFNELHGFK